jgi:hypothetical protein
MPIPPFTDDGDLPVGVYSASLREAVEWFGGPPARRKVIAARLERIYRVAAATGYLYRFIIFGSFVTAKPEPGDVDVFMLMDDGFDASMLVGDARLLFDHATADTFFGASVFWLRRLAAFDGEQTAVEYWQIKRDGSLRGILEVVGEE